MSAARERFRSHCNRLTWILFNWRLGLERFDVVTWAAYLINSAEEHFCQNWRKSAKRHSNVAFLALQKIKRSWVDNLELTKRQCSRQMNKEARSLLWDIFNQHVLTMHQLSVGTKYKKGLPSWLWLTQSKYHLLNSLTFCVPSLRKQIQAVATIHFLFSIPFGKFGVQFLPTALKQKRKIFGRKCSIFISKKSRKCKRCSKIRIALSKKVGSEHLHKHSWSLCSWRDHKSKPQVQDEHQSRSWAAFCKALVGQTSCYMYSHMSFLAVHPQYATQYVWYNVNTWRLSVSCVQEDMFLACIASEFTWCWRNRTEASCHGLLTSRFCFVWPKTSCKGCHKVQPVLGMGIEGTAFRAALAVFGPGSHPWS